MEVSQSSTLLSLRQEDIVFDHQVAPGFDLIFLTLTRQLPRAPLQVELFPRPGVQ